LLLFKGGGGRSVAEKGTEPASSVEGEEDEESGRIDAGITGCCCGTEIPKLARLPLELSEDGYPLPPSERPADCWLIVWKSPPSAPRPLALG